MIYGGSGYPWNLEIDHLPQGCFKGPMFAIGTQRPKFKYSTIQLATATVPVLKQSVQAFYHYQLSTQGLVTVSMSKWLTASVATKKRRDKKAKLSKAWVERWSIVTHCPLTGLPFKLSAPQRGGAPDPLSPSIDRIDPALGYTDANCRVVSFFANVARNAWFDDRFALLIMATAAHLRHQ